MTTRAATLLVFAALAIGHLLPLGPCRIWLFALLTGAPIALCFRRAWGLDLLLVSFIASMFIWPFVALAHGIAWLLLPLTLASSHPLRFQWRRADSVALVAMGIIAIPVGLIWHANGLHDGAYWARGWYERDTQWMWSLVEQSVVRHGWPTENTWLAGLPNVYNSLLHVGLGWLATQGVGPAVLSLSLVVTLYVVAVAGLFVHALAERMGWLALVGWLAFEVVRPDVYPVGQSLAMGGLALLMWGQPETPETWSRATWAGLAAMLGFAGLIYVAHPLVGCVAIALCVSSEYAWIVALFGGLAFQAIGMFSSEQYGSWFFTFNAPRFVHLALLVALPELAPSLVLGALLVALAAPPVISGQSIGLYTGTPVIADADLLRMFEWIRTETPPGSDFVSMMHSMLLPGFTGHAQWPMEERGTYGRTGLSLSEFNARLYAIHALSVDNAAELMRTWGYRYLLAQGRVDAPGLHEAHREGEWVVMEVGK